MNWNSTHTSRTTGAAPFKCRIARLSRTAFGKNPLARGSQLPDEGRSRILPIRAASGLAALIHQVIELTRQNTALCSS